MVVFECEPELNDIIWQESEYVSFLDCATTGVISRDSVFSFTGNGGEGPVFPVKRCFIPTWIPQC